MTHKHTRQQQVMYLLSDIYTVGALADSHTEELNDTEHRCLHVLEGQLEGVSCLCNLRICPDSLPRVLVLALREDEVTDVILDNNCDLFNLILVLIGAHLVLTVHVYLSDL